MRSQQTNLTKRKFSALAIALILTLVVLGSAQATGADMPEGTLGWGYYIQINQLGYTSTPTEACRKSAENHFGTPLVDMRRRADDSPFIECKYRHGLRVGGENWYFATRLYCSSGYVATADGICVKRPENASPPSCTPGEPGYSVGNPVTVSTGAKVQQEVDLRGHPSGTLKIERTYRALRKYAGGQSGGQSWSFSFDRRFQVLNRAADGRPTVIEGALEDGTDIRFVWNASAGKYSSASGLRAGLEALSPSYDDFFGNPRGERR